MQDQATSTPYRGCRGVAQLASAVSGGGQDTVGGHNNGPAMHHLWCVAGPSLVRTHYPYPTTPPCRRCYLVDEERASSRARVSLAVCSCAALAGDSTDRSMAARSRSEVAAGIVGVAGMGLLISLPRGGG